MSKLFLRVGVLAFGSFIFVSGTHAALRVADIGAMSVTLNAPKPVLRDLRAGSHAMVWRYDHTRSATAATEGVRRWPDIASLTPKAALADGALKPAHSGLSCA